MSIDDGDGDGGGDGDGDDGDNQQLYTAIKKRHIEILRRPYMFVSDFTATSKTLIYSNSLC